MLMRYRTYIAEPMFPVKTSITCIQCLLHHQSPKKTYFVKQIKLKRNNNQVLHPEHTCTHEFILLFNR